jgi:hypothetical protein
VSRDAQKLNVECELICGIEAKLALALPIANSSSGQEVSVVRMCHITEIETQRSVDESSFVFFHQQCSHEGFVKSSCAVYREPQSSLNGKGITGNRCCSSGRELSTQWCHGDFVASSVHASGCFEHDSGDLLLGRLLNFESV